MSDSDKLGSSYATISDIIVGYLSTIAIASFSDTRGIFISAAAHTCAGVFVRRLWPAASRTSAVSCENCESSS